MTSQRILSTPIRIGRKVHPAQLGALIAIDALVRRRRANDIDVDWQSVLLAGDLIGQNAVEKALFRSGLSRNAVGREAFVEQVELAEREWVKRFESTLGALRLTEHRAIEVSSAESIATAARTAFVRLFESGLVERQQIVAMTCPRCETVIDVVDADEAWDDLDACVVRLTTESGELELSLTELEYLLGAVAIAVPSDSPLIGQQVRLPVVDRFVPVVDDANCSDAWLVVPAHDAEAYEFATAKGFTSVEVLDLDGAIVVEGEFFGTSRLVARSGIRSKLDQAGLVVAVACIPTRSHNCRRCSTELIPRLGWHWLADMTELQRQAADAAREGAVEFSSAEARDLFLSGAEGHNIWILSHQLWNGIPVPITSCLDCGRQSVRLDDSTECGTCMGTLEADDGMLDVRFVGAIWPLALAGWPERDDGVSEIASNTTLAAGRAGVVVWGLSIAALALQLVGTIPFGEVIVHEPGMEMTDLDATGPAEWEALVEAETPDVVRAVLIMGGIDWTFARAVVDAFNRPSWGTGSVEAIETAWLNSSGLEAPRAALAAVANVLEVGVSQDSVDRLRQLASPIFGR